MADKLKRLMGYGENRMALVDALWSPAAVGHRHAMAFDPDDGFSISVTETAPCVWVVSFLCDDERRQCLHEGVVAPDGWTAFVATYASMEFLEYTGSLGGAS